MLTIARLVPLPENRAALVAAQRVAACVGGRRQTRAVNPLFLHGPPGTGKTHLVEAIVHEAIRQVPDLTVVSITGADLAATEDIRPLDAARDADVLILEDMQHLPRRAAETVAQCFDHLLARQQQMLFTATVGPGQLALSRRLTSRLASGLVIGLEAFAADSRLKLLQEMAQRRQLLVGRDVLAWLAQRLPGGARQLEGAITRLHVLSRPRSLPLDVATVAEQFRLETDATRPTVERIASRVGGHFQVDPRQMQSRRRYRSIVLPRQVSMYLARQLTALSLDEIGSYFGGRDHSTVLHACRKVELALEADPALSGTVRQLHADLA